MPTEKEVFDRKLKVINIGLREFYYALKQQAVDVVQVNWKPPADGDQRLIRILDKLR